MYSLVGYRGSLKVGHNGRGQQRASESTIVWPQIPLKEMNGFLQQGTEVEGETVVGGFYGTTHKTVIVYLHGQLQFFWKRSPRNCGVAGLTPR